MKSPRTSGTPNNSGRISFPGRATRRVLAALIGDDRDVPLDGRLFNSVSLLNTVTNLGGIPSLLLLKNSGFLVALNLGTGLVFLVCSTVSCGTMRKPGPS